METKIIRRLGFSAYFGLEEIAVTREEFERALESRIESCIETEFSFVLPDRKTTKAYREVLLADTFFSDTFPTKMLRRLVNKGRELSLRSKDEQVTFRFLLVNPFSDLARIRASALEEGKLSNVYWRINTGLRNILNAFGPGSDNEPSEDDEFESKKSTIEYLAKQLALEQA